MIVHPNARKLSHKGGAFSPVCNMQKCSKVQVKYVGPPHKHYNNNLEQIVPFHLCILSLVVLQNSETSKERKLFILLERRKSDSFT